MKKIVFALTLMITCVFAAPRVFAQDSPKEWKKHFKQVAETPEYASEDAVSLHNGEIVFAKEYSFPGEKKADVSKKAHIILKNYLEKYFDEYITDEELDDDGDLSTWVKGRSQFSIEQSGFINITKMQYVLAMYAFDGGLILLLRDFSYATQTEYHGQGAGGEDTWYPAVITGKYAVNKKHTKVLNGQLGWLRVGIIDLKKTVFGTFDEKMPLSIEDLEKGNVDNNDNW